ncbi:hypothetical protein QBC34DRAFT_407387 [Podospora aff. communis PSN243]|uniref:Uncharacterized protein n=1 Tax=Podospora aff. communis PSN243 TaxID=3040156 RepID=A0AAV9GL55_9PEZI|nr:hypothetical protein QBC34DRAFT_407387 [Podospora aff. communis PSN243]
MSSSRLFQPNIALLSTSPRTTPLLRPLISSPLSTRNQRNVSTRPPSKLRKKMDSIARSAKAHAQVFVPVASSAASSVSQTISPGLQKAAGIAAAGASLAAANPIAAACGVAAVGGLAVVAAPAILTAPALAAAGFTSAGPAAGSIAAGVQGANVVAGGLFATCQSAAMGGYGVAAVAGAAQAVGGAVAAAGGAAAAALSKKK